jgi:hypothetical protein
MARDYDTVLLARGGDSTRPGLRTGHCGRGALGRFSGVGVVAERKANSLDLGMV